MDGNTVLEIKNLVKDYGTKGFKTNVLKGLNLKVNKNDFIAIMGPSGSGKTSLPADLSFLYIFCWILHSMRAAVQYYLAMSSCPANYNPEK